jgi:hypothetical protein
MRRKQMISLLGGGDMEFERGIALAKDMGFDSFEYGWNIGATEQSELDSVIVDAYLHVNESLYEFDDLLHLLAGSGLAGFAIYGLTYGTQGKLLDIGQCPPILKTSEFARRRYEALSVADKYRFADLLYQPNGYTVMGYKTRVKGRFETNSRIQRNELEL